MERVSIILTTFNCEDHISQTLDSIRNQDYPDMEVVIKDGGSTDRTTEIIKQFAEDQELRIVWVSEPDKGIYDAMNKGYHMSSGQVVVFFNDLFVNSSAVSKMMTLIRNNPEYAGAHADLVYKKEGKVIRNWKMGTGLVEQGWMPGHPTLFLKRSIYEKYGLYDTGYRCSADYEFMIRILKSKKNRLAYLPETIVEMYYGGTSTNGIAGYWISWKEGLRALKQNGISKAFWINFKRMLIVLKQFY